jgi:hypothetical protein
MMRKVGMMLGACALALVMAVPAGAAQARVKGKFIPAPGQDPKTAVLGSAKVKPMADGTWRTGLTLQHVFRSDLKVYVGSFADTDADGVKDAGEQEYAPKLIAGCAISTPTKKGHESCVGYETLEGRPYVVKLGYTITTGVMYVAESLVK